MDPENTAFLDSAFWVTAGSILALLCMSAFFSGSETALTASSRSKLKAQADKGARGAASAMKVTEDGERMIGALLLGNNIVNILAASLATAFLTRLFGDSGVALATFAMTALVLVFGEVLPKTLSITYPEAVATRVAPIVRILIVVLSPVVTLVRGIVRGILWILGVRGNPGGRMLAMREEIVGAISLGHSEGAVEKFRRDGDGVLDSSGDLDILSVAMKPYFIPETTPLDEQMRQFLKRRTHFALVVDEYGTLQGLVTLEDILEEIVGDITDEFDVVDREAAPKPTETGDYLIDGSMTIRDLNRLLDWGLPDDEANTVAGLVIHEAQAIPSLGQAFSFHGFRFEVAERKENRLTRLKVRPL